MKIQNPLESKIGSYISFSLPEHIGKDYRVEDVCQYTRTIGKQSFYFTDYCLTDGLSLRMMEGTNILLSVYDEFGFEEEFIDIVKDACHTTFNIDNKEYVRLNQLFEPFEATLNFLSGAKEQNQYWDFVRVFKDQYDIETTEYLFIELNEENGWTTIWRGCEVSRSNIMAI